MEKLTPEQIENWRKVLAVTIGPYAFFMSGEDIQKTRDNMQSRISEEKEMT